MWEVTLIGEKQDYIHFVLFEERLSETNREVEIIPYKIYGGVEPISINDKIFEKHFEDWKSGHAIKFVDNKANIFVFPEGNNSIYKEKTIQEKFQLNFTKIIKQISTQKKSINIVPIGITYPADKTCMGNVFIGKTLKLNNTNNSFELLSDDNKVEIGKIRNPNTIKTLTIELANELEKCVLASKNIPE